MAALQPKNRNASQTNKPAPRRSRNTKDVGCDVEASRRRVEKLELENAVMREAVEARRKAPGTERPNMLWVTDLTEFSIPAGKAYLSPVIDCHDGMPVAWTIGTSPDSALANGMLADACSTLKDGEKPIIHSDRGCHYRWPEWIRIRKDNNLTRSTGAKGCSPDNAAAEGFFGRPRQEFFHKRSFAGVSMDWFIGMLDEYMVRYRDKRIKTESGHGHHEPAAQTRSCGMIGGDGINDESNKTAPAPSDRHFLYILVPSIGNRGSSQAPSSSKPVSKLFDAPSTSFPQQKGPVENEIM